MHASQFSSLPLSPEILKNLESLGYLEMTPIQAKSLPLVLKNHDIVAKAKTGSGKTAAFGLGLLAKLDLEGFHPQSIVMCPTRELADQVSKEIRRLARFTSNIRIVTLCGGKPFRLQAESLRFGAHIVVGTPGRIQDHINRKTLILGDINTLVLDEADRMLDMGFFDAILDIIEVLPTNKQTLLFSATFPHSIQAISQNIQKNPIEISVEVAEDTPSITQIGYLVKTNNKDQMLIALLQHYQVQSAIVFCTTKIQCDALAWELCQKGFAALAIHSDLEQRDREEVLLQFANNSCSVLVATDVAARGLDIKDLPVVINYDLPSTADNYVHRIGRTGRNGKPGMAISLYSEPQIYKIEEIEAYTKITIERLEKTSLTVGETIIKPAMRTLCISAGKKNKMRPGDILGALTGECGLKKEQVGKIDIFDFHSYVAIAHEIADKTLHKLENGKIKGRAIKVRYLEHA